MMRTVPWTTLVLLLVSPLTGVAAEHAPAVRDLDTRVLLDTTASGDYGDLVDEGALVYEGGHDFLALDVREAYGPDAAPGVYLRLYYRIPPEGELGTDLEDLVRVSAAGEEAMASFKSDGQSFTPAEALTWVGEPVNIVNDTWAVDGFAPYAALNVTAGDTLATFRIQAKVGDAVKDIAPGTYYTTLSGLTGAETPGQPTGAEAGEDYDYILQGPAALLEASLDMEKLDLRAQNGSATATWTIQNEVALAQDVALSVRGPDGLLVELEPQELTLDADASATVTVTITPGDTVGEGDLKLEALSDLGGFAVTALPILGAVGSDASVVAPLLRTGETFEHTFTTIGTFDYHCHPHPWMQGAITIEPAANGSQPQTHQVTIAEPDPDDSQAWGFKPAELTIHAGDTVVWTNEGAMQHNIHGAVGGGDPDHEHGEEHDHADHDHGDNDTPAVPLLLVLAVLLAALLRRR